MTSTSLSYDVMICTLNRPDSLEVALTKIEQQTLRPRHVIIIDASDRHDEIKSRVLRDRDRSISWRMEFSSVKSLPYQRNMGVALAECPILLAPDDDSMLYPRTAERMLAAYERDSEKVVAGVSGIAAQRPPDADNIVRKTLDRRLKDIIEPVRNSVERALIPKPFETYPRSLWNSRDIPEWITGPYSLVETIGGFLLSLRTPIIQEIGFDETLGYGIGYALHEDMELSLRLQQKGYLLVAAQDARIYHDVHPSRRAGGYEYGFCWIANYVYACRKNIPSTSSAWHRDLPRFIDYKISLYRARSAVQRTTYTRDVLAGAHAARAACGRLKAADPEDLSTVYREICDEFLRRR